MLGARIKTVLGRSTWTVPAGIIMNSTDIVLVNPGNLPFRQYDQAAKIRKQPKTSTSLGAPRNTICTRKPAPTSKTHVIYILAFNGNDNPLYLHSKTGPRWSATYCSPWTETAS